MVRVCVFVSAVFFASNLAIANSKLFTTYCTGSATSAAPPKPNYKNKKVLRAGKKLSKVDYNAFYFYAGPARVLGLEKKSYTLYLDKKDFQLTWVEQGAKLPARLKKTLKQVGAKKTLWIDPKSSRPKGVNEIADSFLLQLCAQFRDRASMIEAKLNWILDLHKLPTTEQREIDPTKALWPQVAGVSYWPYIYLSEAVATAKKRALKKQKKDKIKIGNINVSAPNLPITVCETKFQFASYVAMERDFDDLDSYLKGNEDYWGYEDFKENCSNSDLNHYYDYRGDSNFKPYSPESNGMIWYAKTVAELCETTTKAKSGSSFTDRDCADYYKNPFQKRYNAARSGLATWLFRSSKHQRKFQDDDSLVVLYPHHNVGKAPFLFNFNVNSKGINDFENSWKKISNAITKSDLGFNQVFGLNGKSKSSNSKAYIRLRDAVNRHTNWYYSGYNDGKKIKLKEYYSPLVASSHVMAASDSFTAPGYTAGGIKDGRKYWMFVFKIKKSNLYTSRSVAEGKKINFEKHWLDETSLGTNELAKEESALDKLGTPSPDELDAILDLHHILHEWEEVWEDRSPHVIRK